MTRVGHLGSSEEAFKELKSVAKAYADLPLDKIDAILVEQASKYGKDISVAGVDIPRRQLAVWTLVVVLLTQFYLLLQLRALLLSLPAEISGSFHPWLGLSPGISGLLLAFTVYVCLPIVFAC
jgi:hypothetical protein